MPFTKVSENQLTTNPHRKNLLINGGFNFWQRGTTFTSGGEYAADRWKIFTNNTASRITSIAAEAVTPYGISLSASGGNNAGMRSSVELPVIGNAGIFKIGNKFTVSFYANSPLGESINVGYGFRDVVSNGANQSVPAPGTVVVGTGTGSWQRIEHTFDISVSPNPTNTHLFLQISGDIDSTLEVCEVQLEVGDVATSFENRTHAEELALCQRYYEKSYDLDTPPATATGVGRKNCEEIAVGTTLHNLGLQFAVRKRTTPSVTAFSHVTGNGNNVYAGSPTAADLGVNNITASESCISLVTLNASSPTSGTHNEYTMQWTADAEL